MTTSCGFWSTFSVILVDLIHLGLLGDRGEVRAGTTGEKAVLICITCRPDTLEPALPDAGLGPTPSCFCLLFSPGERKGSWLLCSLIVCFRDHFLCYDPGYLFGLFLFLSFIRKKEQFTGWSPAALLDP